MIYYLAEAEKEKHTQEFVKAQKILKEEISKGNNPPAIIVKYKYVYDKMLNGYMVQLIVDMQRDDTLPARGELRDSRCGCVGHSEA